MRRGYASIDGACVLIARGFHHREQAASSELRVRVTRRIDA